jgi:hypothetical protein
MLQAAYALFGSHLFANSHLHAIHLPLMAEYDHGFPAHWFLSLSNEI